MRSLLLITLIIFLGSCRNDKVSPSVSECYPGLTLTRGQRIVDMPVTVQLSGGLISGSQLITSNGVAWSSCNLPREFGLKNQEIYVSGYLLNAPELDTKNIYPLPFEVTSAKLK